MKEPVAGVCIVRNAIDLLPLTCGHYLRLMFDRLKFIDDGSVDGTFEFLLSLSRCDERVTVERVERSFFAPTELLNDGIADLTAEGFRIIFPFDADEFWNIDLKTVRERARGHNSGVFKGKYVQFVQSRTTSVEDKCYLFNVRYRAPVLADENDASRYRLPFVCHAQPPKIAFKWSGPLVVDHGQDNLCSGPEHDLDTGIEVFHLSLRNPAEIRKKAMLDARAMRANPQTGSPFSLFREAVDAGKVDEIWAENSADESGLLDVRGKPLWLIPDDRLKRSFMRAYCFMRRHYSAVLEEAERLIETEPYRNKSGGRGALHNQNFRRITLAPPEIQDHTVTFRWDVEPSTLLYRQNSFMLRFPSSLDLSQVPERLWWDVFLICVHSHWLLLHPCEVRVPIRLGDREKCFWLALLQNGADTIGANRDGPPSWSKLNIEIVDGEIEIPRARIGEHGKCGTAFSGGKDSLLQTGLLAEMSEMPLLVATTSPMPPLQDHGTTRRREIFSEIQRRRRVHFIEVQSDFRSVWANGFPGRLGYKFAVNELTDTYLYLSSLLVAAAACGVTHLFIASEAEVQENVHFHGRTIQHKHFMYSAATLRALARLLSAYGIELSSLTWPLYAVQVQKLLWDRYPDLSDLQYSCWRVIDGERACSKCEGCLRLAMMTLARRRSPQELGINTRRVMTFARKWKPFVAKRNGEALLPNDEVMRRLKHATVVAARRVSVLDLISALWKSKAGPFWPFATVWLLAFYRMRRRRAIEPKTGEFGFREAYLDWLDPAIRSKLTEIISTHFEREPRRYQVEAMERSAALTERATASLQ